MTGDQDDLIARLQRWLPTGWFPNDAGTRIYSIISGMSAVLASIYQQIGFTKLQTRLETISGAFVDLAAYDFFGTLLKRFQGEADSVFSIRIRKEVFRQRLTRTAIDMLMFDVTGEHPLIVELERPKDTGGYGYGFGYGVAGAWASRADRFSVFVTTAYTQIIGIPGVDGYGGSIGGYGIPSQLVYCGPSMVINSGYSNSDILAAMNRIRAAGITYWLRFSG